MKTMSMVRLLTALVLIPNIANAERGAFDVDRWYALMDSVSTRASNEKISNDTIQSTIRGVAFIPAIVKKDEHGADIKTVGDRQIFIHTAEQIIRLAV